MKSNQREKGGQSKGGSVIKEYSKWTPAVLLGVVILDSNFFCTPRSSRGTDRLLEQLLHRVPFFFFPLHPVRILFKTILLCYHRWQSPPDQATGRALIKITCLNLLPAPVFQQTSGKEAVADEQCGVIQSSGLSVYDGLL